MSKTDAEIKATIESHIREYGWHCLSVAPSEGEREFTPFTYSIGFAHSYQAPEVLVFGLGSKKAHAVLSECAAVLAAGGQLHADVEDDRILAKNYKVMFRPLLQAAYDHYLGTALRYYGRTQFDAFVMFLPDRDHRFPWEQGYCGAIATEALAATCPPESRRT